MLIQLLLTLSAVAPVTADTIHVGDVALAPALAAGVETIDNYVIRDGERRLAVTFVQTVSEVEGGYLVVQQNVAASGAVLSLDSISVEPETLTTRWHGDRTPQGSRHVAFSEGGRVSGVAVDTMGHETEIDEEVPAGLYDYSLLTLVADRLPLAVGYEATIATYDVHRGPVYVPIRVVAEETVTVEGQAHDAWRMEVLVGDRTLTRWTEKRTGRELQWVLALEGQEMVGQRRVG